MFCCGVVLSSPPSISYPRSTYDRYCLQIPIQTLYVAVSRSGGKMYANPSIFLPSLPPSLCISGSAAAPIDRRSCSIRSSKPMAWHGMTWRRAILQRYVIGEIKLQDMSIRLSAAVWRDLTSSFFQWEGASAVRELVCCVIKR